MKKRILSFILALALILTSLTGCTDTCKWILCDENSTLFSDYCSDHKEYGEAAEKAADDVKNFVEDLFN
jgi:hypothetical protein